MIETDNDPSVLLYSEDEEEENATEDADFTLGLEYTYESVNQQVNSASKLAQSTVLLSTDTYESPNQPTATDSARLAQAPLVEFSKACKNCTHLNATSLTLTCVNASLPDLKKTLGEDALEILASRCKTFELQEDLAEQLLSPEERFEKRFDKTDNRIAQLESEITRLKNQLKALSHQKQDDAENRIVYGDARNHEPFGTSIGNPFSKILKWFTG